MDYKMFSFVDEVKKRMYDDESLNLYEARLDYLVHRDFYAYAMSVLQTDRKWMIPQIDSYAHAYELKKIVIWGAGKEGDYILALLKKTDYIKIPITFCDNNKSLWGGKREGANIISPSELLSNEYKKSLVIIAPCAHFMDIYTQLGNMLFPCWQVIYPEGIYGHHLYGVRSWQYFDFWHEEGIALPHDKEVFVDTGSLNGMTSVDFAKWCGGRYKEIFAFEANPNMAEICKQNFKINELHDTHLVLKAAWDKREKLYFRIDEGMFPGGSKVTGYGANTEVEADTIDHCVHGDEVTFIKMDIEGSEYNALAGAVKTIEKWKPRLAISLYHKPEDVLEIPYIILKINPEYKFAIRQYASNMQETVLYAW